MDAYRTWIAMYIRRRRGDVAFACASATKAMCKKFPELRRVRGYVMPVVMPDDGFEPPHWWCVAPDGTIVDPTASQWPGGVLEYRPVVDRPGVRVFQCPICGGLFTDQPGELCRCLRKTISESSSLDELSGKLHGMLDGITDRSPTR